MTATLQLAGSPPIGASKSTQRDGSAGRAGQGGEAQAFEGVLANIGDGSASPTVGSGRGPMVLQQAEALGGKVAALTTTAADQPPLLQLLSKTVADGIADGQANSGKSRPTKKDEDKAPIAASPSVDATGTLAMTAALATVQPLSTAAQMLAGATSSPSTKTGLQADDAKDQPVVPGIPAATTQMVSNVKVETHIDSTAATNIDGAVASTDPRSGTGRGSKAVTDPVTSADPAPTPASSDDPSVIVVPATLTPTQAISSAVATKASAPPASAFSSDAASSPSLAPPRTMILQLTPAEMGTVNVTMHLVGQSLDLQLSVSDKNTLGVITHDRESLTKAVQDQGYDLRSLVIQGTDASLPSNGDGNTAAHHQPNDAQQSGSNGQGSSSDGSGSNGNGQRGARTQRTSTDEPPRASANDGAGALYV